MGTPPPASSLTSGQGLCGDRFTGERLATARRKDLVVLLQQPVAVATFAELGGIFPGPASSVAIINIGLAHPRR
ncbi:MAG TPA: hypothetical protein K8V54_03065 [Corynebacterium kroppenstedtii]|nr:hypothetical protein [Corynebacterium kroppenstedtii]